MLPVLSRAERRRIERIIHKTNDKEHARRLTAISMLHQGYNVSPVHQFNVCSVGIRNAALMASKVNNADNFVLCHTHKLTHLGTDSTCLLALGQSY